MPWQSSRINMSHGLFPVSKEKGQGYPTLFQGGEEFNQEHMNCTGALLGPKDEQKTHSLQILSANEKWRRFYIIIKKTGVEGTCLWTAKNIRSQKDYQTQSPFRINRTAEGPLAYLASLLWHRLQDWFYYPLCYLFSSWKVPITESSIIETLYYIL